MNVSLFKVIKSNLSARQAVLLAILPVKIPTSTSGIHRQYLGIRCEKITRQGVDYELRAMEDRGLLERSVANGYLKITPKGKTALKRILIDETKTQNGRGQRQAPKKQPQGVQEVPGLGEAKGVQG